jgi:branched-chain amino acid transport system ATP-binding protein
MLEIKNLNVFYGKAQALYDVSLKVEDGETVAILGRNGAGKTTLLNAIMGLVKVTSGEIIFDGMEISQLSPDKRAKLKITYAPQERIVFSDLTVMENLRTRLLGKQIPKERLEFLLSIFPYLSDKMNRYAGTLSGGEQKMLNIARALVIDPELLLLDEPLIGLMPLVIRNLSTVINSLAEAGKSVILVEQSIKTVFQVAKRVYIMEKGKIVFEGPSQHLLENKDILTKYLGAARV